MITFEQEKKIYKNIIGVDEVGRGPLAGPVIAVALFANNNFEIEGINDSKKISKKNRELFFKTIINNCNYSVGVASVLEIDKLNILHASLLAMKRAVDPFKLTNNTILVDGPYSFDKSKKNIIPKIKGDQKFPSIAAASIIAKVLRDNLMNLLSKKYPNYGWEKNAGYGTQEHLLNIKKFGVTSFHRQSFAPIHKILSSK